MENKVVSNSGPLIHLNEIGLTVSLEIFNIIYIPQEVKDELKDIKLSKQIKVFNLKPKYKDLAELFVSKYDIHLGEAQAIALAIQEKVSYFLTDDFEARTIANFYNLEAHGSVGIILRSFKKNIIDKETAINKVNELYTISSLFITKDIISYIIKAINEFKGK